MFIDLATEQKIDEYELKTRLLPVVYNRLENIDPQALLDVGVVDVDVIIPEPPVVAAPRRVIEGGWLKSANVWTGKWTVVTPDVDAFKAHKHAELTRTFNAAAAEPVEFDNIYWRGGESSAATIQGEVALTMRVGLPAKIMDTSRVWYEVTHEYALDVAQAIGMRYRDLFQLYEACLANLDGAETIEQIEAIDAESLFNITSPTGT